MILTYTLGNIWRLPAQSPQPTLLSMAAVVDQVATDYGIPAHEIMGRGRTKDVAQARQAAMWIMRQQRNRYGKHRWSLPSIGRFFNRDHTTALFACRQHAKRLAQQEEAA